MPHPLHRELFLPGDVTTPPPHLDSPSSPSPPGSFVFFSPHLPRQDVNRVGRWTSLFSPRSPPADVFPSLGLSLSSSFPSFFFLSSFILKQHLMIQEGLKFKTLLPLLPKFWDSGCTLPRLDFQLTFALSCCSVPKDPQAAVPGLCRDQALRGQRQWHLHHPCGQHDKASQG